MRIIEDAALSAILNGIADNETYQIMLHAIQERDEMEAEIAKFKAAEAENNDNQGKDGQND